MIPPLPFMAFLMDTVVQRRADLCPSCASMHCSLLPLWQRPCIPGARQTPADWECPGVHLQVAKFCAKYMPREIVSFESYKRGDLGQVRWSRCPPLFCSNLGRAYTHNNAPALPAQQALVEAFHRMDDMLNQKTYAEELRQLRGGMDDDDPLGEGTDGSASDPLRMFIKRVTEGRPWVSRWQEASPICPCAILAARVVSFLLDWWGGGGRIPFGCPAGWKGLSDRPCRSPPSPRSLQTGRRPRTQRM